MSNVIKNTTKEAKKNPLNVINEAVVFGTSGAIEASEARGQKELVNSDVLPVKWRCGKREDLESCGVVFGEICKDDEIFQEVVLPEGWSKRPTEQSRWSEIIDNKGRVRASVFYKAAFYDRSAHINLKTRFSVSGYNHEDKAVVLDGQEEIYSVPFMKGDYASLDNAVSSCKGWLKSKYPQWESFTAYWN